MAYLNVCVSRHIKEELPWAMDKQLQIISYRMNSYTTKKIKKETDKKAGQLRGINCCVCMVCLLIFVDFVKFLIHDNYEVLYAWCLRYNICSTWFLNIRASTCSFLCLM